MDTIARMRRDVSLHRLMPDGSDMQLQNPSPLPAITDAEVHVAAVNDPDAKPWKEADFARMRPVPRTKTLRRALGLTQEEFAARFHIRLEPCATGSRDAPSRTSPRAPISN
jgi:putative transcriptional regulator